MFGSSPSLDPGVTDSRQWRARTASSSKAEAKGHWGASTEMAMIEIPDGDLKRNPGAKSDSMMAAALAVLEDKQKPAKTVTGIFTQWPDFSIRLIMKSLTLGKRPITPAAISIAKPA